MTPMERIAYDEFGLFHENASEHGLPFAAQPIVRRTVVPLPGADLQARTVSALVWGDAAPEAVFIHGGAQNAHTWDTTIMALGRPAVAVDLPGHGHSGWRDDGAYTPRNLADDVAIAVHALAPEAALVVGMSLGGLTAMELAAHHPHLVRRLMLVDITPGVNAAKAKAIIDFVDGPQSFASFAELLERTMHHNPTRSESSLRRGILHNARQLDDGSWKWRYDRRGHARSTDTGATDPEPPTMAEAVARLSPLWDDFGSICCPITVVRGGASPVVDDDDIAECRRRQPDVRVEVVEGAGHSVQGDRPLELAALIESALAP
jgi:pimeloyl-ACP methyl ester carboxylesterase